MTLHTLKIFALNRLNEICYDINYFRAIPFIFKRAKSFILSADFPLTFSYERKV